VKWATISVVDQLELFDKITSLIGRGKKLNPNTVKYEIPLYKMLFQTSLGRCEHDMLPLFSDLMSTTETNVY
jgi:hypothetical protein